MNLEERVRFLEGVIAQLVASDRYMVGRKLQMREGIDIAFGTQTGTKIGSSASEKLALWGVTPIVQPSSIADVAVAGVASDGTARGKINDILTALRAAGLIAT